MYPKFTISLDFELFWGVTDIYDLKSYELNVIGERIAVPAMLDAFRKYRVSVDWATVGMLMCKSINEWKSRFPIALPKYSNLSKSNYEIGSMVANNQNIFFAPDLVELILNTKGQELCSHTYSHLYVADPYVTQYDLEFDAEMQSDIFDGYGAELRSLVFPRNAISEAYIKVMKKHGLLCFRGNPEGYFHRNGHEAHGGVSGRIMRYAMDHFPVKSACLENTGCNSIHGVVNVPATIFLRPHKHIILDQLHIHKIKCLMLYAAKSNGHFHLWWHPHNFGKNINQNMRNLEELLSYYNFLNGEYGMRSVNMSEAGQNMASI